MQCLVFIATKLVQHSTAPGRKPPVAIRGAGMFFPSHSSIYQYCCCPYQMQQQQQHKGVSSTSCEPWFSNNSNLPRGRARYGITINGRTVISIRAATHIFMLQQRARVVYTGLETSNTAWVCTLHHGNYMLRARRPVRWLLCLLLLLLLVLPKQQPHLIARASLVYFVSISPNTCIGWLCNSITRRPRAVIAAASIFFVRPSALASRVAHVSAAEGLLTRELHFLNRRKHQDFFRFPPSQFHTARCRFSLHVASRERAQRTMAPQTPRSCIGPPREQVVTCCCWYSLAPTNYSAHSLLTTAAKRESSCCTISTAAEHQRRLHAGCPAHFVCKDDGKLMTSTVSSPRTASADVHFTRESSSIILDCGAVFCVVTSTFSNNHHGVRRKPPGTGGVRKCYYCLGFNPECALTSFRPRCNTLRDNACAPGIFFDSRTATFYKSRKSGGKYEWQFRSRKLTVPVSKKRGGSPLFVRPSRSAAVSLAGAAPAAPALNSSPTTTPPASRAVFTSAGRGPAAATADGSAAGGKRPYPAAGVKGVLSAPSALQPPISCCSKAAVRVIKGAERDAPAPSFHAAAAKIAVPLAGGSAAGRPKMPVSITAATEAPESIPATSCTSPSTQTQLHSDTASPLPPGTASYPFTRIEEKWVRYYAEHSDDFSPPLPCSGRAADTNVFTADHSCLSSSFPTPAAPCIKGSFVNKDEFAPEGSQASKSCKKPYVCSNSPSPPLSTKLAEDVDLHTPSPTEVPQRFHLHSQEISKTAEVAAEIAVLDRGHAIEAHKMGALHLGCSRKAVESAERPAEFAKGAPALDSQLSVKIPKTAALCVRETHGQHHTSKRIQSEAVTSVTTGAGYATSWKHRLVSAQHTDIPRQRQRNLERASTPAEERKPEKKPDIPRSAAELRRPGAVLLQNTKDKPVAEASAPPEPAPEEQERKKYYVLSMIPYPSGEGLHVGHCLTYTVADVVARYRRLQLRGELLRSQNSRNGGRVTSLDSEDEEGEEQQVKQQRRREDQEEELKKRAANMFVNEPTNERDGLTCDQSIERRSCEQACWRLRDKDEAFRPDTPVQAVVAHVTENASAPKDSQHSQPTCGFGKPPRTGGEEEGRALLNQRQRETQQAVPRAPQQPDVMHVMGWDAFGLPAEQHALVSGIPPRLSVRKNIETFRRQLQRLGLSVDWRREIDTSDPKYFRWTQWIFLQMWKRGLVYEKAASVNWCDALGTVLADEEVVNGVSTRGQHPVEKKCLEQWHLRITAYADELEKSLHSLDWPEDVKVMQRNWIGKRELLCLHLPLLRPSVADRKRSIARERREGDCQAADERVVNTAAKSGICRSRLRSTSYACDVGRSEKSSSQNGQASCRNSSPPSQADQVGCGAEVPSTTEHAGSASYSGKADREPHSLRCVSVSPEFLFGVTFVVMHAAHKQAYATAVTAAARGWLSAQNRETTIGGDWQASSAVHAEANELPSKLKRSPSTAEQTGANLAEARILRGTESEAAVERQHEDVVTDRNECVQVLKVRNTYLGKESVFSGSYVKHPLTEAALPVWLFSEKLFHQLKGAGTYFNECDAILVAPEQDSVARTFARAAGLPIINVLASGTDKKGASTVRTQTAGGSELVRQQRHHTHPNEGAGEAVDRLVQDVVVNSHSEKLTVNGLIPVRARRQILEHLVSRKTGEQQSVFALRDWVFSRQRFWGEPIPLIRAYAEDEEPSVLAESEANLPVILPEKMYRRRVGTHKRYRSSSDTVPPTVSPASSLGEYTWSKNLRHAEGIHSCERLVSAEDDRNRYLQRGSLMAPLADYPEWWDLTPRNIPDRTSAVIRSSQRAGEGTAGLETEVGTGKAEKKQRMIKLQREVSTMPQWAGSSWYFLRFLDPHNTHAAFDKESARYWMPVDLYVGGKEHAVTHLLYARFWHKVLRDIGLVTCGEPFKRLCTPGVMLGTPQYVAFQRLDTREWVPASSVSLKKGNVLESHISQGPPAKQSIRPGTARSTTTFEVARPLSIHPDHHDDPLSNAESVVTTTVDVPRTDKGAAGIFQGTRAKSALQQYTVAGIHSPSGQPVREVKIDNAAVTRAKGSDVLVLKEDESIEVMCRYEKMSKSRGNVISPDSLIQAYGADALRLHLLFMGPVEARKIWSLDGIKGVSRFLNRVWHLVTFGSETSVPQVGRGAHVPAEDSSSFLKDLAAGVGVNQFLGTKHQGGTHNEYSAQCTGGHALPLASHSKTLPTADCPEDEQATSFPRKNENCSQLRNSQLSLFEKTLLKQLTERVTRHVERLAFNRALAALMCAVKKLSQWKVEGNALSVHSVLILVRLLHPFAPFITEELWFKIHKRFPDVARYASSPSLLACGVWPSIQDPEFNTYESAKDESNPARKWGTHVGTEAGSEPAADVAVHFDGKFHVKVQVPAVFMNDKNALEAHVKRDIRVAKYCGDKKVLRAIVLLKAKLINFVTAHVNSSDDESKKQN